MPKPHLAPENCYVCGGEPHGDGTAPSGHKFWSNKDAAEAFAREPIPNYSPEAAYINQHRPY